MNAKQRVAIGAGLGLAAFLVYRWYVSGQQKPASVTAGCSGSWFSCFTGTESTCSPGYAWVDAPALPAGGYCGRPCALVPGCSVSVVDDDGNVLAGSTAPQDGPITSPSQIPDIP